MLHFERLPLIGRLYTTNARRFPENVEYGDIVKAFRWRTVRAGSSSALTASKIWPSTTSA